MSGVPTTSGVVTTSGFTEHGSGAAQCSLPPAPVSCGSTTFTPDVTASTCSAELGSGAAAAAITGGMSIRPTAAAGTQFKKKDAARDCRIDDPGVEIVEIANALKNASTI